MQRDHYERSAIAVFICVLLFVSFPLMLPAADIDLIPENISLLDESLAWDKSFDIRTGVGYKDNVLLRHSNPPGSPFVASGLDASVIRLPIDGLQFYFFFTGDDYRYWHDEAGVDKEEVAIAVSEVQKDFGNGWNAGLNFEYAYQNQVLDVSSIDRDLSTAKVQGHRFTPRPFLRRDLTENWWMKLEWVATRQIFRQPLDSWWQVGPKFSLGHEFGNHSQVSIDYEVGRQFADTRTEATASGDPIPGTSLNPLIIRMALEWRQTWDANRHWRTTTKLVFDDFDDTGSRYFSFYRYQVSEQLRFQSKGWELSGKVTGSYYDFPVQAVSDTDPSKFQKAYLSVNLRAERTLTSFLKLFAEYEIEHARSNQPLDRYRVNTISGGMDWQF